MNRFIRFKTVRSVRISALGSLQLTHHFLKIMVDFLASQERERHAGFLAGQPVIFCWRIFVKFQLDKYDFHMQNAFLVEKTAQISKILCW
jgi:hypothetical protein